MTDKPDGNSEPPHQPSLVELLAQDEPEADFDFEPPRLELEVVENALERAATEVVDAWKAAEAGRPVEPTDRIYVEAGSPEGLRILMLMPGGTKRFVLANSIQAWGLRGHGKSALQRPSRSGPDSGAADGPPKPPTES